MRVFGITMVKDEIDVIEYTLKAMAAQGVECIIVADNMSTDGTWELLHALDLDCKLVLERDEEVGYFQSEKMTAMAQRARMAGAEWVIPFDADEIWQGADGRPLVEVIDGLGRKVGVVSCHLNNYFPRVRDDADARNPYQRIEWCDRDAAPLSKVAVRTGPDVRIEMGNHSATGFEGSLVYGGRVRHYPWRSFDQFTKKCRNGARAYAATDLPETFGGHWRGYGVILEHGGEQALFEDVWMKWFYEPTEVELVYDPAPVELFL